MSRAAHVALGALIAGAVFAGAIGAGAATGAVAPELVLTADRTSITVGDPVEVTATLTLPGGDAGRAATLAGLDPRWGRAELLDAETLVRRTATGRPERAWRFRITAFETGRLELPPLEVRIEGDPPRAVHSGEGLTLEVRSVLPEGDAEVAPMPPAPPHELDLPAAFGWTVAALLAAIALAAWAATRRAAAFPAPPATTVAAGVELELALAALAGAEPRVGHTALSRALRRFLGRTLDFHAVESTTVEVARALAGRGVDPALARRTRRLLVDCDGVKFARRPTTSSDLETRRAEALSLAHEVEAALAPPPPLPSPGEARA